MANAFLNPVAVSGVWGEPIPAATQSVQSMPAVAPDTALASDATALAIRPKAIAWVRMAPDILRAMGMAANHAGRNISEVWAEAAREWLLRKSLEADYDVAAYMPARRRPEEAALDGMRRRLWTSIDSALDGIRQTQPAIG